MTALYQTFLITIIVPSFMGLPTSSNIFNISITAECPLNATSHEDAILRKHCSRNTRYMCAPYKNFSYLLEYCTSTSRSLFIEGNCLTLQDSGFLDKFECEKTFADGCPNTSFHDENLYKYPACLTINTAFHCFVAERDCPERLTIMAENITVKNVYDTSTKKINQEKDDAIVTIFIITMVLPPCIAVVILVLILQSSVRRKKKKGNTEVNKDDLRRSLSKDLKVYHARCIILGCGGAGKSTLLARLQDKPYKEIKKIERTQGIDVYVNIFEVLKQTIQGVRKETPESSNIVFSANDNMVDKSRDDSHKNDTTDNEIGNSEEKTILMTCPDDSWREKPSSITQEHDTLALNVMNQGKESTAVHKHSSNETGIGKHINKNESYETKEEDKGYAMKEIIDAVTQLVKEKPRKPRITFLDFAGQDDYYAFHQIYLSPKTFYILVVDMTKPFNGENKLDERYGSRFSSWKYKDYYKFWLKSIDSFSDTRTPVIVVGTHADGKTPQECKHFYEGFYELFDGREDLQRHLHTDRRFSIKFPSKGSKLENLSEIKKCISSLVQGLPYWEESMRSSWVILEQFLQREKTLKERKLILHEELLEYNLALEEEFKMKEEEITTMLLFLHRVGALLFIDEDKLRNTIILDVQWFVEAFKCIINHSVSMDEPTDKTTKRFHGTGELQDTDLDAIWRADSGHDFISNKDTLITFMEELGLLAVCDFNSPPNAENGTWYYFPSMNRRTFDQEGIKKHKSSSILCFQFDEEGQLPIFLFYHLVLKCFKLPDWSILSAEKQKCMYDRVACFCFQKHIVVICICKFQIQVQVFAPTDPIDPTILKKVQMSLEHQIQEVFRRGKEVTKRYTYFVGYKCQNGVLNDENDNSFIKQELFPFHGFLCERCNIGKKHNVENSICWNKQEAKNSDTLRPLLACKEITDEALTSWENLLDACLDGNAESFFFHLHNTFNSRKHLLKKLDRNRWNALHFAARGGNLPIFKALLLQGLDIFQKTNGGMTILHIAAQYAQYNICQYVLEMSEFNPVFKETSAQGKNACHYAAEGGCIEVLKLLQVNGIDVKATTDDEQNIFHIACIYDKLDMCEHIARNYTTLIHRECNDKWNATLHAAKEGNIDILKFLHVWRFSFVHKSESDRSTLHIACDNGHLSSCKFITEVCPSLLNDVDHKGRHAGHFAARNGSVTIMEYLVSQNAKVTKTTNTGMNILHMACLHENIDMCKYIFQHFRDLNLKKTERGWTTVHFLAGRGRNKGNEIELFDMITKDNVEINALTKRGNSVLALAIKYNLYGFSEFLFQNHPHLLDIPNAIHPLKIEIKDGKMTSMVEKYTKDRTAPD